MGNTASQEFCPDLAESVYDSHSDLIFTIPYIFVFIALVIFPFLISLPCLFLKYVAKFDDAAGDASSGGPRLVSLVYQVQNFFLHLISVLDLGISSKDRFALEYNRTSGELAVVKTNDVERKNRTQQEDSQYSYMDFTSQFRAIGGFMTAFVGLVIFGAVVYIYIVHEAFITESVIVHPSGMPSKIDRRYLTVTVNNLPCKDPSEVRVVGAAANNVKTLDPVSISEATKEDENAPWCTISFNMPVFGAIELEHSYEAVFQVTKWNPLKEGDEFANERHVDVRVQSPLYRTEDGGFEPPSGPAAFIFMDSCRRTQFENTKTQMTLSSSMTLRSRCEELFGTAVNCFQDNLSLDRFSTSSVIGAEEALLEIRLDLGPLRLNSFVSRRSDAGLFSVIILGIISLLVFQPIFKKLLVDFVVSIIKRRVTGRTPHTVKAFALGVGSCFLLGTISFILFMFVTDVYFEFKKQTAEFVFSNSIWIFGRSSEFMVMDVLFALGLIAFNLIAYVAILSFTFFYLVYKRTDQLFDMILSGGDLFTLSEKQSILSPSVEEASSPVDGGNAQEGIEEPIVRPRSKYQSMVESDDEEEG